MPADMEDGEKTSRRERQPRRRSLKGSLGGQPNLALARSRLTKHPAMVRARLAIENLPSRSKYATRVDPRREWVRVGMGSGGSVDASRFETMCKRIAVFPLPDSPQNSTTPGEDWDRASSIREIPVRMGGERIRTRILNRVSSGCVRVDGGAIFGGGVSIPHKGDQGQV